VPKGLSETSGIKGLTVKGKFVPILKWHAWKYMVEHKTHAFLISASDSRDQSASHTHTRARAHARTHTLWSITAVTLSERYTHKGSEKANYVMEGSFPQYLSLLIMKNKLWTTVLQNTHTHTHTEKHGILEFG
jgi:hypothetical protein